LPEATQIAADFLATLDKELRDRSELHPLFDSRALDTTANATTQTAQSTAEIAQLLRTLLKQVEQEHTSAPSIRRLTTPYRGHQPLITSPTAKHTTNPSFPTGTNPFVPGPIRYPEHFYGRKEQLAAVKACIGAVEPTCVSVIGMKYSGKSSLLFYIRERINIFCNQGQNPIAVYINFRNKSYWSSTGLIEGLRRGIKDKTGLEFWQPSESSDNWSFYSGLKQPYSRGYRLIILTDEFETIKHRLEDFQGWGEDWHAKATEKLLTMVLASQRPLRDLYASCGLVSPFDNIFTETRLGALENETWHQLVRDGFSKVGYTVKISDLDFIEDVAGGTPYYTQLAAIMIWQYRDQQRAREQFRSKAQPHFEGIWNALNRDEQSALLYIAGIKSFMQPSTYTQSILRKQGLIKADSSLFSSIFAEFVQNKSLT
jgi:hypothetical protein